MLVFLMACGSTDGSGGSGGSSGVGAESGSGGSAGAGGDGGTGGSGGMGGGVEPEALVVFVTSSIQTAALGGFDGADATCAGEATSAGLEGEFKAWLSTLDTAAADRLTQSSGPYVLTDGTRIADNWNDLIDNQLLAPINLDAMGRSQGGDVWTGTLPSGQPYEEDDCAGYTSDSAGKGLCGSTGSTGSSWSAATDPPCRTRLRLFCFEQ